MRVRVARRSFFFGGRSTKPGARRRKQGCTPPHCAICQPVPNMGTSTNQRLVAYFYPYSSCLRPAHLLRTKSIFAVTSRPALGAWEFGPAIRLQMRRRASWFALPVHQLSRNSTLPSSVRTPPSGPWPMISYCARATVPTTTCSIL
jgi:hypothetical protein